MELNWNWFMSVDFKGRWLMTKGRACFETWEDDYSVSGTLYLGEEQADAAKFYAKFVGKVTEDGKAVLTVTSADQEVLPFELTGTMFDAGKDGENSLTFVLTDGTTVLGLTHYSIC